MGASRDVEPEQSIVVKLMVQVRIGALSGKHSDLDTQNF
jgi:hypothetical protein